MNLKSSLLTGFGISNKQTYMDAIKYSNGAIIGSAFINHLKDRGVDKISDFIKKLKD
jgi:tryptophan synthase alpha chain